MRILMLSWEYPPRIVGGMARVVYDLSHRLIKDGHEVTVITYRDGNTSYYENDKGVEVYRIDNYMINPNNFIDWIMQLNFNMVAKATEIMNEKGKFDVIHAHDWLVTYATKSLKESFKIPVVATIHATENGRNSGIHDEVQRYINDTEWLLTYESTEVIVNSNFMKGDLQRIFGLPFEKINVIPNGINLNNYSGIEKDYDFRRQYAMDNEKIILYVGRLVYEKGIQHLIAAMPKILTHYHDAKLVICGRGGMMDELVQETRNLGIENKVYFAGYCDSKKVQKMYKCADMAVFPSTYEPFGIEIVEHRFTGMKSYAGNANSIADSVLSLLFDPKLCDTVSKNAVKKVKEMYSWNKIAQDTHYVYEQAICQSEAQKQANKLAQEKARKTTKAKNTQSEITNLLNFRKRNAYA